ncbi:hypothetical protein FIT78_00665 [Candidatus Methylopumilus universalis]|uniref:hypothetical protein n=1 Tax=Candidatus Methylopumilus universalis TaxID=2588536 RepID=UPI0011228B2F|nr:hypothetical protein [Candidatus Methylopumilus universalis]QDC97156.1 hypothetical protein FIT78_00665 [Candidatus Methylopumilus universalis]
MMLSNYLRKQSLYVVGIFFALITLLIYFHFYPYKTDTYECNYFYHEPRGSLSKLANEIKDNNRSVVIKHFFYNEIEMTSKDTKFLAYFNKKQCSKDKNRFQCNTSGNEPDLYEPIKEFLTLNSISNKLEHSFYLPDEHFSLYYSCK